MLTVGGGRSRQAENTQTERQAGQVDGAVIWPHLQEPASSTSVWGTDAREEEKRAAGAGTGERAERKRERVTSNPINAPMARMHSPALPAQPSDHLSFPPSIALASPRAVLVPPHLQGLREMLSVLLPAPSSPAAAGWSGGPGEFSVPVTG